SLAHLIGDYGPLPPRFVCVLLDQLLSGLTAVHAEGVVHRDIKPANILLEATGRGRPHLRLSDFGIAMRKGEPRLTDTNYVMGTPGYFAPEQMLGEEPDFPADLFAVGLVTLYLITGRKPDAEALVRRFTEHGTPNAPEDVPEPLWQVVANLLQPDPYARFRTATGARKALAAAVELLPEPAPDEEPIEVFDQLGPLPPGFGPNGPCPGEDPAPDADEEAAAAARAEPDPESGAEGRPDARPEAGAGPRSRPGAESRPQPRPKPRSEPRPPAVAPPPPAYPPTRPYTAPQPFPGAVSQPPGTRSGGAAPAPPSGRPKRPGPPSKVAVPVLVFALLCLAVGIWALTVS
ncbi:serine/threonine-protein kinase, partial [Streptomyces syringium]|uniref:serine/threonine-protein kinase n=1 Tax=Streptomyces syringium TaxID=76729 RepID=UPI0033ED247D